MQFESSYHSYESTGLFSPLVTDYLKGHDDLRPFYSYEPSVKGVKSAVAARNRIPVNRQLLFDEWMKQYAAVDTHEKVRENIRSILLDNTFTVCTAHQPNIFTGPLYFVYKILHAVSMAEELNRTIKESHFVPVYYMGSEDADLDELGVVYAGGQLHPWKTNQSGAVGRMRVDDKLTNLIDQMEVLLTDAPFSEALMTIFRRCYTVGKTIQQATFELVNELFGKFGLLVLLPDNPLYKKECAAIFEKELQECFSRNALMTTIAAFPPGYKVQTSGREINLFYLKDFTRERIEPAPDGFIVANTGIHFTKDEMFRLLKESPEYFSPNVILRPLMQESLLPNVAFIGGGSELAYWLELKSVFESAGLVLPVLMLRNTFVWVDAEAKRKMDKLSLAPPELLKPLHNLVKDFLLRGQTEANSLSVEINTLTHTYKSIAEKATAADITLSDHVASLFKKAHDKLDALQHKMLRAEKRKQAGSVEMLESLNRVVYPLGQFQERILNLSFLYSTYGETVIDVLHAHSQAFRQECCMLVEK